MPPMKLCPMPSPTPNCDPHCPVNTSSASPPKDVLLYGGPPGGGTPRGGGGGIGEDSLPRLRLPRALLSLMCLAARMAPQSAGVAGCELMGRLSRMLGRSTDGRLVVMPEYLGGWWCGDGWVREGWAGALTERWWSYRSTSVRL